MYQPIIPPNSQAEAQRFLGKALDALNRLATLYDDISKLMSVWYVRDYANKTSDTDFGGIPKSDVQNLMYLFDSLKKYLEGQEAPKADFTQTINKLRSDL